MNSVLRDRKAIVLFVAPGLLLYFFILLIPIGWSVGYTFQSGSLIRGMQFTGLSNYVRLFGDPDFLASLLFSLRYTAVVTTGQIIFGFLLAMLFLFYLKRASFIVRTLVFFPVVLPTVAIAQMFSKLFEIAPQLGLVNAVFDTLGLEALVLPWLGLSHTAFIVLVIMDIWKAMGFYAVILYAGLIDIPTEVLESAQLDGARGWKLTRFIVLPLIRPILMSAVIYSLAGTLKVFDSVVALTGGGPGNSTNTLSVYMYKTSFTYSEYGYGSTLAFVLFLECLLVTLLVYRFTRKDVTA